MALVLTGRPGVGKTTAVRRAARKLAGGSERRGFRLTTFGGDETIIAHVDLPPPRVSKYGVDVPAIGRFASALRVVRDPSAIYLVDEIGKMECLSFVDGTRRLLDSGRPFVATIAQRGSGFIEEVKRRTDIDISIVTAESRNTLPDRIVGWVRHSVSRL